MTLAPQTDGGRPTRLVIFAEDWGRHPSSCQHLIGQLLDRYPTLWMNTIGMRRPGLSRSDMQRAALRLSQWTTLRRDGDRAGMPHNLTVMTPRMWPWFQHGWERRLNGRLISRMVNRALGPHGCGTQRRIAISTLPIAAPLLGRLDVDAWVYYCVDDFSVWPGLDNHAMRDMECALVAGADQVIAASRFLQDRVAAMGRRAALLTHGVDLAHWVARDVASGCGSSPPLLPNWWDALKRPILLFWGLIDRRLDLDWMRALQDPHTGASGSLVLVGPVQSPDPRIESLAGVTLAGAVAYDTLPTLAAHADVLVMPYADLPVTRAMQPLKFKEYLATGKPVVVRRLPATVEWSDAADVVDTADAFVRAVVQRARTGTPTTQLAARRRLIDESWEHKAKQFEALLRGLCGDAYAR